eukprot:jgi/Mesen1/8897/ME000535S08196
MASIAATSCASAAVCFLQKDLSRKAATPVRVQGLPSLSRARVTCSAEKKSQQVQFAAAATAAASFVTAHPALALVDERLSTEGMGLSLGLSNSALGWILVGVSATIWSLYFVFSSKLPEGDDDSGLSL